MPENQTLTENVVTCVPLVSSSDFLFAVVLRSPALSRNAWPLPQSWSSSDLIKLNSRAVERASALCGRPRLRFQVEIALGFGRLASTSRAPRG